jgi:CheY-like chemotaxis protein
MQQQNCYSATLLDLTMPGGPSGFETLEVLRSIAPQMPVIACSGYFQDDARELCQAIGFYDIISKPYNFDVLGGCVRRAVNGLPAEDVPAEEQALVTV